MTFNKTTLATTIALASLFAAGNIAPATAATKTQAAKTSLKIAKPSVGIALQTNKVSRAALKFQIGKQTKAKGVHLSRAEMNQAVDAAINKLASAGNGPQKGIIHLKFRRFTICISWGADKGHC